MTALEEKAHAGIWIAAENRSNIKPQISEFTALKEARPKIMAERGALQMEEGAVHRIAELSQLPISSLYYSGRFEDVNYWTKKSFFEEIIIIAPKSHRLFIAQDEEKSMKISKNCLC